MQSGGESEHGGSGSVQSSMTTGVIGFRWRVSARWFCVHDVCNCDDAWVHVVVSIGADESATWMLFGGILNAMIYIIGSSVRGFGFLRRGERPWYFSSVGNDVVFMGSLYVGVRHHNALDGIIGFTLLVVSALGFLEITRPDDYGLLQSFMKMFILICFMCYGFQWNSWLVLPSLLAVYGIIVLPWIQSHRLPPGATQRPNSQVNSWLR